MPLNASPFISAINARTLGVSGDHDGTLAGGTDATTAFAAAVALAISQKRPLEWVGGIKLGLTGLPVTIPAEARYFVLRGASRTLSYIYVYDTAADGFLKFAGGAASGYDGYHEDTYVNGEPPPPPSTYGQIELSDFSIWGRGSEVDGDAIKVQKGIVLTGRNGPVSVNRVTAFNFYGTAFHFGATNGTWGGFRESTISEIRANRCGTPTEPAIMIEGTGATFAPNFLRINGIECNYSRGDGLHIKNTTVGNSTHAILINGFRAHGTGGAGEVPLPFSKRGLVIEGLTGDSIEVRGIDCNQYAVGTGEYAVEIIGNATGYPKNVLIEGVIKTCQNGVLIEGGSDIVLRLFDIAGIDFNTVELGDAIDGRIVLDLPSTYLKDIVSTANSSLHAEIVHSVLLLPRQDVPPLPWTRYQSQTLGSANTAINDDVVSIVNGFSFAVDANARYKLMFRANYDTAAAADFKYSIVGPAAPTAVDLTQKHRAPSATDWTSLTPVTSYPANETVAGGAGVGGVEVTGFVTNGATAGTIGFRFAQGTADASTTTLLAGSFYEAIKLA